MTKKITLAALAASTFLFTSAPSFADDAAANALLVEAVQLTQSLGTLETPQEKYDAIDGAISKLDQIVSDHPTSNLAVALITGQPIGNMDLGALKEQRVALQQQLDANAQANDEHARWVEEIMGCLDEFECTLRLYKLKRTNTNEIRVLSEMAGIEAMKNGFSDSFDEMLNQAIALIPAGQGASWVPDIIGSAISPGIMSEDPSEVMERIQAYASEYIPADKQAQYMDWMLAPASAALWIRDEDKLNEFAEMAVDAGFAESAADVVDDAYRYNFEISLSDVNDLLKNGFNEEEEPVQREYKATKALGHMGSPDYQKAFDVTVKKVQRNWAEYDPNIHLQDSQMSYLVATGEVDKAAEMILTSPEALSVGGMVPHTYWHWVNVLAGAGLSQKDEARDSVMAVARRALEESEEPRLDDSIVVTLTFLSQYGN